MKRLITLTAALALSSPFTLAADEPPKKSERLNVLVERPKADAPAASKPEAAPKLDRRESDSATTPAKPAERKMPAGESGNIKVQQLPGGGIQVSISESGAIGAAKPNPVSPERAEDMQRRLQEMMKHAQTSHREGMRARVRRQRELTKQASKLLKKLDDLGSDESPKAREVWQQLERIQGELLQTVGGPHAMSFSHAPGQPAAAWIVQSGVGMAGAGIAGPGASTFPMPHNQPQLNPATPRPQAAQIAVGAAAPPQPSNREVLQALESLRHQVEELRAQVRKLSEK